MPYREVSYSLSSLGPTNTRSIFLIHHQPGFPIGLLVWGLPVSVIQNPKCLQCVPYMLSIKRWEKRYFKNIKTICPLGFVFLLSASMTAQCLFSSDPLQLHVLTGYTIKAIFLMDWRWYSVTLRVGCAPWCSWRAAGVSTSWTPWSLSTCPSSGQWTITIRSCSESMGMTFLSSCRDCCILQVRTDGSWSQGQNYLLLLNVIGGSPGGWLKMLSYTNPRYFWWSKAVVLRGVYFFSSFLSCFCVQGKLGLYFHTPLCFSC